MNRAQLIKDIKNNTEDKENIDFSEYTDSEIWELFKEISKDYKNYHE